jgi:hypothetical protein
MAANLLRETWTSRDSHELRLLLDMLIDGHGQFDGSSNSTRLYLPLAGPSCQIVLKYRGNQIVAIERGPAFDADDWERVGAEIETLLLTGPRKVGREYSFNSRRVPGWWKGNQSGVQILPPPPDAPRAAALIAEHPFILEFPIQASDYWPLTNLRRQREHRNLTLLLNVLLAGRTSLQPRRSDHHWAVVDRDGDFESVWVQDGFFARLGNAVIDELSPPIGEPLEDVEPEEYYDWINIGLVQDRLRVPADLDRSICLYQKLSGTNRAKFDRATFWLDMASRQWSVSVSASFAALISAVESLTDKGEQHWVNCEMCKKQFPHDAPGAKQNFQAFLKKYAPGAALEDRRSKMYRLRSDILHGSTLMTLDQDLTFGFGLDLPWWNEYELHSGLWGLTRVALRDWLANPPAA